MANTSTPDGYESPQTRYDKKNCKTVGVKLNKKTDSDILTRLGEETNRQGYIKRLIRDDIARRDGRDPDKA